MGILVPMILIHAVSISTGATLPRAVAPEENRPPAFNSLFIGVTWANAAQLAQSLAIPGSSNPTTHGAVSALATFTEPTGALGLRSGILLSTGNAASVNGTNDVEDVTTGWGTAGDDDLGSIIGPTYDAASFECDVSVAYRAKLTIRYVFASEEYNEFIESGFNDAFACFLDGDDAAHNIARAPGSGSEIICAHSIHCGPAPRGVPPAGPGMQCSFFRNNDVEGQAPLGEMDGLTQVLTNEAFLEAGLHHIKFVIADANHLEVDSDVFINVSMCTEYGEITSQPQPTTYSYAAGASLSVGVAAPSSASYQWRRLDPAFEILSDGDSYSGTRTHTLTLGPGNSSLAGTYDCTIAWPCTSAVTAPSEVAEPLEVIHDLPKVLSFAVDPNPSPGPIRVRLALPRKDRVEIGIYDASGRHVARLASEMLEAGTHSFTWNGQDSRGRAIRAGVYFFRLDAGLETRVVRTVKLD